MVCIQEWVMMAGVQHLYVLTLPNSLYFPYKQPIPTSDHHLGVEGGDAISKDTKMKNNSGRKLQFQLQDPNNSDKTDEEVNHV